MSSRLSIDLYTYLGRAGYSGLDVFRLGGNCDGDGGVCQPRVIWGCISLPIVGAGSVYGYGRGVKTVVNGGALADSGGV